MLCKLYLQFGIHALTKHQILFLTSFSHVSFSQFWIPIVNALTLPKTTQSRTLELSSEKTLINFLKNATDSLSKVNTVCQQHMVVLSLKNYLGLHCKQMPHRVSGQGTGNLA